MSRANDTVAIKVHNVHKSFKIPLERGKNLKQHIVNFSRHKKGYRKLTPLNGVSFEIRKGDFFGIVGRNGSGKSTLLKTVAGIYTPEDGYVKINGTLVPFIELGVGFNPELTGKENVYLNGALLGFSRKEMDRMYNEVVDFAELHDFMGERLKNYSSGMQVRLAFSIAIQAKGDILLLDEVLAVGDAAFQQKCNNYFEQLKTEGRTIVLVTHSMEAVKRFCSKALLLENGEIKLIGSPEEVADQYTLDNIEKQKDSKLGKAPEKSPYIKSLSGTIDKTEVTRQDVLKLTLSYELLQEFEPMVGMSVISNGRSVSERNSIDIEIPRVPGRKHSIELKLPLTGFNTGLYSVNVSIFRKSTRELLEYKLDIGSFVIEGNDQSRGGVVYLPSAWTVKK